MTSTSASDLQPTSLDHEPTPNDLARDEIAPSKRLARWRRRPARPLVPPTQRPAARPEPTAGARVVSTTLTTIAIALLMFVAYLVVFSGLVHAHTQHLAYADFRKELALGTAPTGPTDPNNAAKVLALGSPVAVLSIPAIHVNEVVFEGTTPEVLEKGPGHSRDSVLPGQAGVSVLFGRSTAFGGPFGNIDQLQPGAVILVTTGQGVQQYSVLDVRRAGDPVPEAPGPKSGRLVLDTADGPPLVPSGVVRVDADLTSSVEPTPTQVISAASLLSSEPALATDDSAWVPLVLWGQALLVAAVLLALARIRWGRGQVWVVAVPVIAFFAFGVAEAATRLLPNLT
jgi:sortase A